MNNRIISISGIILTIFITISVKAQTNVLVRLIDKDTGKPIKEATIIVPDTDVKTTSNFLGFFELLVDSAVIINITCPEYPDMQAVIPAKDNVKIEMSKALPSDNLPVETYIIDELPPSFPGGPEVFYDYINKNIKIPKEVKNGYISGKVQVEFVIDSLGQIPPDKIKVIEGLCKACDEEAVRLIRESPKWNPGILRDKPVNILMFAPIPFRRKNK